MSLPVIIVTDRHLRDISDDAWKALIAANDPPAVFQRGHDVVDIVWIDGRPTLRTLDISSFRGRLDRVGNFMALARGGPRPIPPPRDLVADMLASPELPLPLLEGIAYAPFFAASGQLVDKPGYHSASRRYLSLPKGLCMPRVSPSPDASAVFRARELLLDELLGDFPFGGEPDKAHAVAALLLPFVRGLIPGPTPLHILDSPSPGSGKDLLGDVLAIPAVGTALAVMPEGRDEDEFRRQITSVLDAGPQFVRIGNVQRPVKSPALAAALTGISWSDRLVGSSRQAVLPVLCV